MKWYGKYKMMKFTRSILLLLFLLTIGYACDYVEAPYFENHETGGEIEDVQSNVLILDFTGHTCKSCPKAHRIIHQLTEVYGDRIVPVAFHLGYFARVSGDKYSMDFNTGEGAELESYYNFVSYPIGLVNTLSKNSLSPYPSWATESAGILEKEALIAIDATYQFDQVASKLNVDVSLIPVGTLSEECGPNLRLAMYLTESHILAWQKDEDVTPMDVENYEHNHVFRKAFGSIWGESVSLDDVGISNPLLLARSVTFEDSWLPQNSSVVLFVYNSETMEVIQSILVNLEI